MRTYLECFPCFLSQAFRAARTATGDEKKIKQVIDEVGMMFRDISLESTPPETGRLIYSKVRQVTGVHDPYENLKVENTRKALSLYPLLKEKVRESRDRLLMAIRVAIAGNIIDFGANPNFDMEREVRATFDRDFAVCDYEEFKAALNDSPEILYLGDNAGETVFDRVLIEELGRPVIYAVRDVPVINDATRKDAERAGIDKVATIISSGTDGPGTILGRCNETFLNIYRRANLIISKGQGNYEALSSEERPIFFLLKVKCMVAAKHLGVKKSDILLKAAIKKDKADVQKGDCEA